MGDARRSPHTFLGVRPFFVAPVIGPTPKLLAIFAIRQYTYGRELKQTPELDLIVWEGDAYRELKPSPPHHRFGVEFDNYVPQMAVSRASR